MTSSEMKMELLGMALFSQQVCVLRGYSDEEIEVELSRQQPTGLSGPMNDWRVTTRKDAVRVACEEWSHREHIVLACGGFAEQPETAYD